MKICYRKEFVGCFGKPIDENPTVVIMQAAFEKLGLDYLYNASLVEPEDLGSAVQAIRALHWVGANTTVPHKVAVMAHLDEIDESARLIGAVNTIYWKGEKLCGANTDGKGFTAALAQNAISPVGKSIVILGAGGAAKAIAVELALAGAKKLTIVGRTVAKAQELADVIGSNTTAQSEAVEWIGDYTLPRTTDILINATDIGLYPDKCVPALNYGALAPTTLVCDVIPTPPRTPFLQKVADIGCKTLDGQSMLVQQAVIAIKIWTGLDAPADVMRRALQAEFAE